VTDSAVCTLQEMTQSMLCRLHRMHEMQIIVTDVRRVCLSICLSVTWLILASLLCKNGSIDQDAV